MRLQRCVDDLLVRGTVDVIQAAELAGVAATVGGAATQDEIRELSLDLIREVLQQGFMRIGDLNLIEKAGFKNGFCEFCEWGIPAKEALARVQREWKALGRGPALGEICWLCNTEKGNEIAERLLGQGKPSP